MPSSPKWDHPNFPWLDNLKDLGIKWIFEKQWEDMKEIQLAQDRDQWQVLVNTTVNLQGSKRGQEFN